MAVIHSLGMYKGYIKYKSELDTNWMEKCSSLDFQDLPEKETLPPSLKDVRHFVLIPAVNEPFEVLKDPFENYFNQTFPTDQVVLVYTIEEKYAKETIENLRKVFAGRESSFANILIYTHPAGIPGEAIGAGAANRTWGAKHAIEELLFKGENLRNYIFSTFDADHVIHPQFLARLTHLYLTSDKRDNKFFQSAVALFDNNYWEVPVFMRIEATSVALGGLSEWSVKGKLKDTFAAYSSSLQTLIDVDYWDVSLGVDDQIFYWRAFFARKGDFIGVPHHIPYYADAVSGHDLFSSCKSLYKQLLRWGWGVIDFPLSVKGFLKNKEVPFHLKIAWMIRHFEKRVLLIDSVFLITFGFALLTFFNPAVKQATFAYSLPKITSMILTSTVIFFVPITLMRFKIVRPLPEDWPYWKKFLAVTEGPLVIFNMLSFSFLPQIEAQTRMLLGKKMKDLYHTPKMR
ncbi:MAG TPA: glycosyltransferase family 2 protein [candidate division WWE3 bacterium]|uniref:Glycosyltransferase family 2 protein n=1 Tax=candidate division WWE3 bacterium TaxID=2053526 RepID=A0A7C1DI62_UNCKA|nr:glycosyltransferase family 2 protein [candidate division WWE3 bacterium]